jgi:hypothetical protein
MQRREGIYSAELGTLALQDITVGTREKQPLTLVTRIGSIAFDFAAATVITGLLQDLLVGRCFHRLHDDDSEGRQRSGDN